MDVPCTDVCTFILSTGQCDAGIRARGALGQREQSCGCKWKGGSAEGREHAWHCMVSGVYQ